jgi:hypothetical protein
VKSHLLVWERLIEISVVRSFTEIAQLIAYLMTTHSTGAQTANVTVGELGQ